MDYLATMGAVPSIGVWEVAPRGARNLQLPLKISDGDPRGPEEGKKPSRPMGGATTKGIEPSLCCPKEPQPNSPPASPMFPQ